MIQYIKTELYQRKATYQLSCDVLPQNYSNVKVKKGVVKTQDKNTEQTSITYTSKWIWYVYITTISYGM